MPLFLAIKSHFSHISHSPRTPRTIVRTIALRLFRTFLPFRTSTFQSTALLVFHTFALLYHIFAPLSTLLYHIFLFYTIPFKVWGSDTAIYPRTHAYGVGGCTHTRHARTIRTHGHARTHDTQRPHGCTDTGRTTRGHTGEHTRTDTDTRTAGRKKPLCYFFTTKHGERIPQRQTITKTH